MQTWVHELFQARHTSLSKLFGNNNCIYYLYLDLVESGGLQWLSWSCSSTWPALWETPTTRRLRASCYQSASWTCAWWFKIWRWTSPRRPSGRMIKKGMSESPTPAPSMLIFLQLLPFCIISEYKLWVMWVLFIIDKSN